MESNDKCIRYQCGCEREVESKVNTFCDAHINQRYNYEDLLRHKRRIKELIRLCDRGDSHVNYLKRQLRNKRKEKKAFWAPLQECPQIVPKAIGVQGFRLNFEKKQQCSRTTSNWCKRNQSMFWWM